MPLISPVPVQLDPGDVVRVLRLDRRPGGKRAAGPLLAEAASLLRPRAFYREAFIESRSAEGLTIGGRFFRSRLLRCQFLLVQRAQIRMRMLNNFIPMQLFIF